MKYIAIVIKTTLIALYTFVLLVLAVIIVSLAYGIGMETIKYLSL